MKLKLIQVYECFCDETRLRILNLLSKTPLSVSHLQTVLKLPQVKISKHLAYLKERGMVEAKRCENWMIYSLPSASCPELVSNLKCLQDCSQEYPFFEIDLKGLECIMDELTKILNKVYQS